MINTNDSLNTIYHLPLDRSWEEPPNTWLTVAKNTFVGWALNCRVRMLNIHTLYSLTSSWKLCFSKDAWRIRLKSILAYGPTAGRVTIATDVSVTSSYPCMVRVWTLYGKVLVSSLPNEECTAASPDCMGSKVRPVFCEVISSTEPFAMDPDSTDMLRVTCCGSPNKRWWSGEQSR